MSEGRGPAPDADWQSVALIFSDAVHALRPDLSTTPLSGTLSAINAAGLAAPYRRMYASYKDTGLFDEQVLRRIGDAVHARYAVELKLASFDQQSTSGVFSVMGVSLGREQSSSVRLLLQIWDMTDGKLVWEQSDTASEKKRALLRSRAVSMDEIVKASAEDLIKQLPR